MQDLTRKQLPPPERSGATFVFSLATQFENLGDCLINELLLEELARKGRVVVLARRAPTWLLTRLKRQESIVLCRGWWEFLRAIGSRGPQVFVFKPGHWVARPGLGSLFRLAAVTSTGTVLRACGWRLARVGVSLDNYGPAERWLQGALGRLHSLYGVRDAESAVKARKLGIAAVGYTPDLAFLLPVPDETGNGTGEAVALSLRQRPWMGEDSAAALVPLAALADRLKQVGCSVSVVQQVTFDEALSAHLAQALGCARVNFAQSEDSAKAVQHAYASSSIVISNRLHGLLFGWAGGAIPLAIVDDRHDVKIASLFQKMGLEELLLPIARLEDLTDRVIALLERRDEWTRRLSAVFSAEQQVLQEVFASEVWSGAPFPDHT